MIKIVSIYLVLLCVLICGCETDITVYVLIDNGDYYHPWPAECSHLAGRLQFFSQVSMFSAKEFGYKECDEYHLYSGWQSESGSFDARIRN